MRHARLRAKIAKLSYQICTAAVMIKDGIRLLGFAELTGSPRPRRDQ